ncbi:winged helix-turn-helix domain-containing protein [Streptomyces sp. NPDC051940]|uniref:ArsR/SmtB family transcription factor n=1 Tax=Streptomyces sp. NPDC051940 TaxID=3155675 RepID=UPI0034277CA2
MLRLHFNDDDLHRVRVAPGFDPLWELVLATTLLGNRDGTGVFGHWRAQARAAVTGLPRWQAQLLRRLAPGRGDFPDFLTPPQAVGGLEPGLQAVLSTPRAALHRELTAVASPPSWCRHLAEGDREALGALEATLRACYAVLVAPYQARVDALVHADIADRARDLLHGGPHRLLAGLAPVLVWRPPILTAAYPVARDIHLAGRGLLLVPSVFCWRTPVTLIDPLLPPVVAYPVSRGPDWSAPGQGSFRGDSLAALLGATRAAALRAIADGCTTGQLAARLGISAPTASEHAAILRESGLIISRRSRNQVLHSLAPMGTDLLGANPRGR